jgi:hypothetical protein
MRSSFHKNSFVLLNELHLGSNKGLNKTKLCYGKRYWFVVKSIFFANKSGVHYHWLLFDLYCPGGNPNLDLNELVK